jgi:hypothetical protein
MVAAGQEEAMLGVMSERPHLLSAIIAHGAIYHRDTEIVSRTPRRSKRMVGFIPATSRRSVPTGLCKSPITGKTGKLMKTRLREMFRDHRLPDR